jgi:apolipoprotein N-acyltransferase
MNTNSNKAKIRERQRSLTTAITTGLLLVAGWFPVGMPLLLLFAFVPLLLWENEILNKARRGDQYGKIFLYSFIAFAIFNVSRGWWVAMSAWFAIVLPFFNAMLMASIFTLFHCFRMLFKNRHWSMIMFPILWLIFENINTNWDFNFPWLNLGNGFADFPSLVQWYEFTGAEGGTLWIALTNVMVAITILAVRGYDMYLRHIFASLAIIFVPLVLSLVMYCNYEPDTSKSADIVLLQPNLDPYNEQYSLSADSVTSILLNMAASKVDENTDYVIAPESCLQEYAWEERIMEVNSIEQILKFNEKYPRLNWIAGMSTRNLLPKDSKSLAARKRTYYNYEKQQYDTITYQCSNVALNIGKPNQDYSVYWRRKTYLTSTVEKMPLRKYLPFLENLALNLGGTIGSLAIDSNIYCFQNTSTGLRSGVMICYESACGNLVRKFSLAGNQILFCITNDGWWGNTQGYRQHKSLSRLRAVENRRYLCRAANTGISCVISPKGEILQQSNYWTRETIKSRVYLQEGRTFYAIHGDYLYLLANITFLFLILCALFQNIKNIMNYNNGNHNKLFSYFCKRK